MAENRPEYEIRPYTLGELTRDVRVQVLPGRHEGEPIFAQHFDAAGGWSDASIYDVDGVSADYFRAPFNLDTLPELDGLPKLTSDEQDVLDAAAGARLGYSSYGFVGLTLYELTEEFEADLALEQQAEAEAMTED